MKHALLLLALLAVPCVVTSCKDDAATVSPFDNLCKLMKLSGQSEKEIKILRAGYEGDTVTLESLKDKKHIAIYCTGAAAAGKKELVLQCFDKGNGPKGAGPNTALGAAACGGHMDIVQLMLDKGATNYNSGLFGAALGGHMDIVQLMLYKGADDYNKGLSGAAYGGHMDIVQLMLKRGATDLDSALNAAESNGHTKCAELIRAAMKK